MDFCVFDLEISKTIAQTAKELGLRDEREAFSYPHKMDMSIGVAYSSTDKEYHSFLSAKLMAKHLLDSPGILISFNGKRFDLPVLLCDCDIDTFLGLQKKKHLDILADFYDLVHGKFRVSLNNLAQNTLGKVKGGNGADAPLLFQQGKIDELREYCQMDVQITREIFEFGAANGYVRYFDSETGKVEEMPVKYAEWLEEE